MVDKFLRACDGLPLSLKVFGALLHGNNDKSYWQDELDRLEQILPFEIQKRLQISFDALERDEQDIFLDIACFFIGENRDTALRIWDGSGWKGSRGFQSLLNKCLTELDNGNKIRMHDHLRDLGRDLAKSRLPYRLWGRARNMNDLFQQSVIKVRGIKILRAEYEDNDEEYASLEPYTFRELQLLDIDHDDLELEPVLMKVQSPNLLWLRWDNFPYSCLPSWIPLKNLRVLKMDGLELKSLWLDELKAPLQLRELEIYAPLTNIPESIGQLKHLERIVVTCGDFLKLQGEFCHRPSLRHLPESLGDLTSLEHIDLSYCGNLERLPNSFGNLIKLKHLNLKYCSNLRFSSGSLGNISTLEYINLYRCDKIEVLPSQIAHQRFLENLNLNLRNLKEWPSSIGVSSDLEKLVLKTPLLETLPPSLGSDFRKLRYLELGSCQSLKRLPDSVRMLNQLIKFLVKDCSLQELPFKTVEDESKTLSTRSKRQRQWSTLDSSIDDCMLGLQQFQLFNTQILDEVSFAEGVCPTLKYLDIQDCNDLVEVGTLPKALTKLVLIGCSKLRKIKGLCGLTKLQILNISWCQEVEELPSFETLVSLEELQVSECVNLKSIQGLEQLTQLIKLDVSGCSELEELRGVGHLISLNMLRTSGCVKLKSIQVLEQLTQLLELHVCNCFELEELLGIEHLKSLKELLATNCKKLKSIQGLEQVTQLKYLDVSGCYELEKMPDVGCLESLVVLRASECVKLKSIQGLEQMTQLRELDVSYCLELEELPGFERLKSLMKLQARCCTKLKRIKGLAQLAQLRELDVSLCPELEERPDVECLQ